MKYSGEGIMEQIVNSTRVYYKPLAIEDFERFMKDISRKNNRHKLRDLDGRFKKRDT